MNGLNIVYIACGGAAGAVSRFLLTIWVNNKYQNIFPYGTFTVNILGCFFLGMFYALTLNKSFVSPQVHLMISVGFIGAFTTFSTFSLEALNIVNQDKIVVALLYIALSVIIGLIAIWIGITVGNLLNNMGL